MYYKMLNNAKTIIYKLIIYDYPDLVYVGSTTNLTKRNKVIKKDVQMKRVRNIN